MQARHNLNMRNCRSFDWLIWINSNTPAGWKHLKGHFVKSQWRRRTVNHRSMNGKTFGIHFIPQKILFFHILHSVWMSHLLCDCRGGTKNEKCPVAIAYLVLLYNAAQEGLYGPVKHDRSAFDLFALCLGTTNGFVKFCKAHEQRICINLHDFRVIRADAEEGDNYINVSGFLTEWTKSKNRWYRIWYWNLPAVCFKKDQLQGPERSEEWNGLHALPWTVLGEAL